MLGQLVGWFGGDAGRVWFVRVLLPVLTYGFLVATAMNFGHAITVEGVEGQLHGWLERLAHERPFAGAALLAAALLLSTLLIQALDLRWTRLLEGYWPSWPVVRWSRRWHVFAHQCDHREMSRRLAELEGRREARALDDETFAEREWLDVALERYPGPQALFMPTRFGNILRAAEQKIEARYGLNGVILWPRLWLVLPDAAKSELTAARSRIAFLVRLWWLSVLLLPWALLAWWLAVVSVIATTVAYRQLCHAAGIYGDLFVAVYEVHRFALYRALRWPLPRSTAEEKMLGEALTRHVWRGADPRAAVAFRDGGGGKS